MMNHELWNKIAAFDLDNSPGEYIFSIRLADENQWTKEFTKQAILEYKKFMYMAATADFMVSPSEIVDIVWHQHLIFSQSYQALCHLVNKQIQHIPSTHNQSEYLKFKQAKLQTKAYYQELFGTQPKSIWEYKTMTESLHLHHGIGMSTINRMGFYGFLLAIVPAYLLLRPIYTKIENTQFFLGLIGTLVVIHLLLYTFNRKILKQLLGKADQSSFIFDLHPMELKYLQTSKLPEVINGTVNELITKGVFQVDPKEKTIIMLPSDAPLDSLEQLQAKEALASIGKTNYPTLMKEMGKKPVFKNIEKSMNAIGKYYKESKEVQLLYAFNVTIAVLCCLLSFTRILIGYMHDKSIFWISIFSIILSFYLILFLALLSDRITSCIIPEYYKQKLLPIRQAQDKNIEKDWQWSYFLNGNNVLNTAFLAFAIYANTHGSNSVTGGAACGSNCGGGDGDGGGGCGGCGGCGGD